MDNRNRNNSWDAIWQDAGKGFRWFCGILLFVLFMHSCAGVG